MRAVVNCTADLDEDTHGPAFQRALFIMLNRAISAFGKQLREDVILAIVGSDDGYQAKLEKRINKLFLSDKVMFTGFLNGQDKLAALVDADVVVQPSRYEQAAWAPIEAVLCGTPVIVSEGSGSGEDVSRMEAGYLVEYDNKSQMVETIQTILNNPQEAETMVNKAQAHIRKSLVLSEKVKDYENLYIECIEQSKPFRRKT